MIADESGATAIEYGLLVALLGVVVITAISLLGEQLWALIDRVGNGIATASGGADG